MSHDTQKTNDSRTPSTSSIAFGGLIIFLFIAMVNFVNVMSHDEDAGHGTEHATEHAAPAHHGEEAHHDATEHQEEEHHEEASHEEAAH